MKSRMECTGKRCNVLVNGLLSSGSSAVIDLLREYSTIGVVPGEFDSFRAPGLVADQLQDHSSRDWPNEIDTVARIDGLKSKLIYQGISSKIVTLGNLHRLLGESRFTAHYTERIKNLFAIYYLRQLNGYLQADMSFKEKTRLTRKWIQQIGSIYAHDKEFVLFDQPILTTTDRDLWRKVFSPFKLIYVFRDPRDQLADIVKRGILFKPYGAPFMNLAG